MSDKPVTGSFPVKRGLAEMLKGGVIMDVVTPEQAKIASWRSSACRPTSVATAASLA
jgi:pyridoxal biosynthesis lyase PdxS